MSMLDIYPNVFPGMGTTLSHRKIPIIFNKITDQDQEKSYPTSYVEDNNFISGSKYTGDWNPFGMTQNGIYYFAHGVTYEGEFKDGMFHGEGILGYPNGLKVECVYEKGKLVSLRQSKFLLRPTDRRFPLGKTRGMRGAPEEFKTSQQPTKHLDTGFYDTSDGIYMPEKYWVVLNNKVGTKGLHFAKYIMLPDESNSFTERLRMPNNVEASWIMRHCRKGCDDAIGYRPDLYEKWSSGRKTEREKILEILATKPSDTSIFKIRIQELPEGSLADLYKKRLNKEKDNA